MFKTRKSLIEENAILKGRIESLEGQVEWLKDRGSRYSAHADSAHEERKALEQKFLHLFDVITGLIAKGLEPDSMPLLEHLKKLSEAKR